MMYVWPHMHLLGKTFKAYSISPTGDTNTIDTHSGVGFSLAGNLPV
ncbi:MAG: hypothetical protein M3342_01530 [Bacteroidota bacterium]|nr:hypothetical protein [Bacteroidota bacterium]